MCEAVVLATIRDTENLPAHLSAYQRSVTKKTDIKVLKADIKSGIQRSEIQSPNTRHNFYKHKIKSNCASKGALLAPCVETPNENQNEG